MSVQAPDRLERLLSEDQKKLTGIDFVEAESDSRTLYVHFLKPLSELDPGPTFSRDQIEIYRTLDDGSRLTLALDLVPTEDPEILRVVAEKPGGFSRHWLRITHPQVDRHFREVEISFKAFCRSEVDCAPRAEGCPVEASEDFPVDYQARDFWSLRRALMEFAAQRYPEWLDRGREADVGVMWAEVVSALGDELAYYQDRVAREAYLETATERRSVRRHARLVDYELHDGLVAHGWLDVTVRDGLSGRIPAGFGIHAASDYGPCIGYEVGRNLREVLRDKTYAVDAARNGFAPHIWDEDAGCLAVGSTELFVRGHHAADLPLEELAEGRGRWLLLRTLPRNPAIPARAWMVRAIAVEDTDGDGFPLTDPLIVDPETGSPMPITRLEWDRGQALPFEMDLATLEVRGNLVPVMAGTTLDRRFVAGAIADDSAIPAPEREGIETAVERVGPNGSTAFLHTLVGTESAALCRAGADPRAARPEICLVEDRFDPGAGDWRTELTSLAQACEESQDEWCWRRSLLGVRSSQPEDRDFTLDDGQWGRVVGYQRNGREIVHRDYMSGAGATVRFGDGEFGRAPARETIFRAIYRVGNGAADNVAAHALTRFEAQEGVQDAAGNAVGATDLMRAVTNPLPIANGTAPEALFEARKHAPMAFRSETYRAVTAEDHADAVERLAWVQRAGSAFRWTGSWLSAFVTADPIGSTALSATQREEARLQLDRFRQAGREAHLLDGKYVDLDLQIRVCVEPSAYRSQVKERVTEALLGTPESVSGKGFFSPDNFSFGAPLERSVLEQVIQRVPGVRAVEEIRIARRGHFEWQTFDRLAFTVADDELIRVENDLDHPDRGSVKLEMAGGA